MCRHRRANWKDSENCQNTFKIRHRGPGHVIGFLVRAFMLKILWNLLVPSLFGGPVIGFLQALGILFIGKLITGGPGGRFEKRRSRRWKAKMKKKLKEKMEDMTPEERKAFKEKMMDWEVNVIEVEDDESEESNTDEASDDKKE